jgi:putative ABC transport system permease protein
MLQFVGELRYGCRLLFKNPVFSIVALLTIALGAGATVAIFTVVDATLLAPLPYQEPEELVTVWWASSSSDTIPVSPIDLHEWQQQRESFESLLAYHPWDYTLLRQDEAERLHGAVVYSGLFDLLGVSPALGRSFDVDGPGAPNAVILSDRLWKRTFSADPEIVGTTILLEDKPYEVYGVMPEGFRFPMARPAELWVVSPYGPSELPRDMRFLRVVGRLKEGVSVASGRAEMTAVAANHEQQYPETNTGLGASVTPMADLLVKDFRQGIEYLQIAVLLTLGIACFNVSMLQLTRASVRRGEVALRLAVGASRGQLFRQFLIENLLLALCGGALGLAVAYGATRLLIRFGPSDVYRLEEAAIDGRVLMFALAVTLLSGLLFGLVPSLRACRYDLRPLLAQSSGQSGTRAGWTREAFAFLQVAITLILLIGAGLLMQSLARLSSVSPGFRTSNLLTMRITLPEGKATIEEVSAFYGELKERVEALPGVVAFATSFYLPMGGGMNVANDFDIEGRPQDASDQELNAFIRPVSPGFFGAMEIPVVAGREFTERDTAESPGVVVINQRMAELYWSGESPLGERLRLQVNLGADVGYFDQEVFEIVGVAGDVKRRDLSEDARPEIYFSSLQGPWRLTHLIVPTESDAASLVKPVTAAVHAIDPSLPVERVRTMEEIIAGSLSRPRFNAWLLSCFAIFAIVLTAVGLYGVLSYLVQRRRNEIGLRMALGASKRDVLRLVVGRAMISVLAGLAVGLAGAVFFARFLAGLLFGVSTTDPATFAGVCVILSLVALLASYLPARRAVALDPMTTLRYE